MSPRAVGGPQHRDPPASPLLGSSLAIAGSVSCAIVDGGGVSAHCAFVSDEESPITLRPVEGATGLVDLAVGDGFACGRRQNGAVLCWGSNYAAALGTSHRIEEPTRVELP